MPLAEMTRCIAHPFESFSDGRVLRTHGATGDIDPNRVPPREHTSSGRGAIGSGCKSDRTSTMIEPSHQSASLNEWMPIIAHVAPALVVSHNKDEIGLVRAVGG